MKDVSRSLFLTTEILTCFGGQATCFGHFLPTVCGPFVRPRPLQRERYTRKHGGSELNVVFKVFPSDVNVSKLQHIMRHKFDKKYEETAEYTVKLSYIYCIIYRYYPSPMNIPGSISCQVTYPGVDKILVIRQYNTSFSCFTYLYFLKKKISSIIIIC